MNPRRLSVSGAILAVAGAFATPCSAEVTLGSPFTDHAVLQRDVAVPVWGWNEKPGVIVTVTYRGQTREGQASGYDGRWHVTLDPMPASAEPADLVVITEKDRLTLHDLVVGEVWLASGQSNMEWPLNLARDGKQEVASANFPLIRHLKVQHSAADLPADTVRTGGWQTATPGTAGGFTAVGYFFARALSQKLGVPVGIIHSSWGATPIESWLAGPVLRQTKAWPGFNAQWQEALKVFPQKQAEYPALDAAWRKADDEARTTGKPNPLPWPHPPVGPGTAFAPGGVFNGMIAPLAPYALRGVLWYQGEGNVGRAAEYAKLFPAMIKSWRATWRQGDVPFYFVQLPNFADNDAGGRKWAELREAQAAALALPNTGMVVAIDLGDPNILHPTNKQPVGARLALVAEANAYGLAVESTGPVFQSALPGSGTLRLKFTHAAGLTMHATTLTAFEVAGADTVFHPATARIEGETVIVSAPEVPDPVVVRYAWTNSPAASLYNSVGLPATPFRTDDW